MSDDGTTVQKQGEIIAVQPTKTGWTEIHLQEEGKQYPYKASTKIEAIIEQAQAALFKEAVLTAKEVDSGNPNPNRPGYNYINRTAMKVEVGGTVAADIPATTVHSATVTTTSSQPTHAPLPPGDKDRAITRMAVLKAAAEVGASIEYAPGEDVAEAVIAMAARFETWVYRDTDDLPFE